MDNLSLPEDSPGVEACRSSKSKTSPISHNNDKAIAFFLQHFLQFLPFQHRYLSFINRNNPFLNHLCHCAGQRWALNTKIFGQLRAVSLKCKAVVFFRSVLQNEQ